MYDSAKTPFPGFVQVDIEIYPEKSYVNHSYIGSYRLMPVLNESCSHFCSHGLLGIPASNCLFSTRCSHSACIRVDGRFDVLKCCRFGLTRGGLRSGFGRMAGFYADWTCTSKPYRALDPESSGHPNRYVSERSSSCPYVDAPSKYVKHSVPTRIALWPSVSLLNLRLNLRVHSGNRSISNWTDRTDVERPYWDTPKKCPSEPRRRAAANQKSPCRIFYRTDRCICFVQN
jgi:hypothetical protein